MIKIVKPIYELSKTDKDLVANALRFSIYSMPIFKENAKIRHFLDNPSNCSVLFVNKSVFKDVKPVIYAFEKSLRNKEKDNSNSEYRAAMGIISEYLLNKKLGCLSINTTSHSYSDAVKYPCDTGHFMGRLEVKSSHLSSPSSHQKQGYGSVKGNRYILHATTDECIVSIESLKEIRGIEKYYSNFEDYYLVIFHGVMTTNSFNYHMNKGNCSPARNSNDKKVEICDDIYKELISIDEYIFKYLYRMTSPLHLLNCVNNSNYVRLFNTVFSFFFKSLHTPYSVLCIEPLMNNKGKLLTSMDKLYDYSYDRYRRNASHFKFYNSITIRFACPHRSLKHSPNISDKIRFIDMEISIVDDKNEKSGKKIGKVDIKSRFTRDMPNFNDCDEDTIENFIRDNFTKYPVIGYGLRGIFGLALKNHNRNCISGENVQHTAYYMDIDDMLNVFSISDNDALNKSYREVQLDTPFFYDWRCFGMLEMIPDSVLKSCLKMDKKDVMDDLEVLVSNIENITGTISSNLSNSVLNDIEFLKLVPLFYIFYLLTHIFSSRSLPNNLKHTLNCYNPTYLLSPKGLYDYNNEINNYVKTGFLEDLKDVLYDGVNIVEYNYVPIQKVTEEDNQFEDVVFGEISDVLNAVDEDLNVEDISKIVDNAFEENLDKAADKALGDASQKFINHMENEMCEFSSKLSQTSVDLSQSGPVDSYPIKSENIFALPAEDINISIDDLDLLGTVSENEKPNVDIDIEKPIVESIPESFSVDSPAESSENVSSVMPDMPTFGEFNHNGFGEDAESPLGAGQPNNMVSFGDIDNFLKEKAPVSHSVLYDFFDKEFNFSDSQVRAYLTRNYVSIEDFREMLSKKILDVKDMTSLIEIFRIIMK